MLGAVPRSRGWIIAAMSRHRSPGWTALVIAIPVLLSPAPVARGQNFPLPPTQENLVRVEDLEDACSGGFPPSDQHCRTAVLIALGKEPTIEETRLPNGGYTHNSKLAPPEPAKAGWFMEEACAHKLWDTCMMYALILERGSDGIPQDRSHAEALTQAACSDHHSAACESLAQDKIPIWPNSTLPPVPAWVRKPTPRPPSMGVVPNAPPTPAVPIMPMFSPTPPPGLDEPLHAGEEMEGEIFERCRGGSGPDCYRLALYYKDMAAAPDRINHYYEKACDFGHRPGCTKVGRAPSSSAGGRSAFGLLLLLGIAGLVVMGTILIIVVVKRR
jgi:hypothetical protein